MLRCWLLRQLQCKWDSNMWYCVSRYHSSLMTSFLDDIIPWWWHSFLIKISHCLCCTVDWKHYIAYVALLVAEAVTVQMRQQYMILCLTISFLLDDIIPWRHHPFLIKLSDCICCAVGCWGSYGANETAICDIVFQDTIPPWRHHPFLIKLSDCICCAVGCWGSYSANETAIYDIVFQDTIPPWRHHSFLIKLSDCICCAVGCWGSYGANETAICDIVFRDTIPPWCPHSLMMIIPWWLNIQIAYVASVPWWGSYSSNDDIIPVILCFNIPFLLDDIIP